MLEFNNAVDSDMWSLKGIKKETSRNDEPKLLKIYQEKFMADIGKLKQVITSMMSQGGTGGGNRQWQTEGS
eukprot:8272796-Ditylum_brightwellii.AAC.1